MLQSLLTNYERNVSIIMSIVLDFLSTTTWFILLCVYAQWLVSMMVLEGDQQTQNESFWVYRGRRYGRRKKCICWGWVTSLLCLLDFVITSLSLFNRLATPVSIDGQEEPLVEGDQHTQEQAAKGQWQPREGSIQGSVLNEASKTEYSPVVCVDDVMIQYGRQSNVSRLLRGLPKVIR